jgi:ribose transport system substrate-binding protein
MRRFIGLMLAGLLVMGGLLFAQGNAETKNNQVMIITPYLSSVTTKAMCDDIQAGLKAKGIPSSVIDTASDFGAFGSRIEDATVTRPLAIVIVSADPNLALPQIKDAIAAGVPVLGCDSGFVDGMTLNATSDNYAMGKQVATYLFHDLMGDKGTVVSLSHRPHPGVVKRSEAFDDLIKQYPGITMLTEQHVPVPNAIENSRQIMENLLAAYPEKGSITAVFCGWDEPAIGATQAAMAAGRDEILITGVDGTSQALDLIAQGTPLKATLGQDFSGMAQKVVDTVYALSQGKPGPMSEVYVAGNLHTK